MSWETLYFIWILSYCQDSIILLGCSYPLFHVIYEQNRLMNPSNPNPLRVQPELISNPMKTRWLHSDWAQPELEFFCFSQVEPGKSFNLAQPSQVASLISTCTQAMMGSLTAIVARIYCSSNFSLGSVELQQPELFSLVELRKTFNPARVTPLISSGTQTVMDSLTATLIRICCSSNFSLYVPSLFFTLLYFMQKLKQETVNSD